MARALGTTCRRRWPGRSRTPVCGRCKQCVLCLRPVVVACPSETPMSKYDPLLSYLSQSDGDTVPMGFSEIEQVLGFELPPSSRRQRAWWSNNPANNVMTRAWLDAGY